MSVPFEIRTYEFNNTGLEQVSSSKDGKNWPVVYMIHNDKALYIGETTSAANRMGQHLKNPEKNKLKSIEIVFDKEYNKSVVLDYEQKLIKYCSVDKKFPIILNKNRGQQSEHDYFNREGYRNRFVQLWDELKSRGLVHNSLTSIENRNIFKFSPYNALTAEQNEISVEVINDILNSFETNTNSVSLVDGCAGTGKTVLAISIINSIVNAVNIDDDVLAGTGSEFDDDIDENKRLALIRLKAHILKKRNGKPFKVGFVFPMPGIRGTISRVFKECGNGLDASMVIGPTDVTKEKYDILFVDESHRLSRRKNLTGYGSFDATCEKLGLDKNEANQLDWVLKSAKHVVLFYDKYQSVKSSDITYESYHKSLRDSGSSIKMHKLQTQMRCQGGDSYMQYIKEIMLCRRQSFEKINNYDFILFDDVQMLVEQIQAKDDEMGLCKTVAGFAWDWKTKPDHAVKDTMEHYDMLVRQGDYDILIENHKFIWNLTNENWITRQDSHNTIGCIHTTQGFDMNYVGVIFGEEIDYDSQKNEIVIDVSKYKDKKVKAGMKEDELKELIINTYTTILARGIKGCYVYACNPSLREYLRRFIVQANNVTLGEN